MKKNNILIFGILAMLSMFCVHASVLANNTNHASNIKKADFTPLESRLLNKSGFEIKVHIPSYKNGYVYLSHYLGREMRIIDSALLNEQSMAVFQNTERLNKGIYRLSLPDKSSGFDILMSDEQQFTVKIKLTSESSFYVEFENSRDNTLLNEYQIFMYTYGREVEKAQEELSLAQNEADSTKAFNRFKHLDKLVAENRANLIKANPQSFFSKMLMAMIEPELPENLREPSNPTDSIAAKQYVKDHYWDGVNLWEPSLIYTPFFDSKMENYLGEVLQEKTELLIKDLDKIMDYARANDTMNEFMLRKIMSGAMSHLYHWSDSMTVHIFEKYIADKKYAWLDETDRKAFAERAYFIMGKNIGSPAPTFTLPDSTGKLTPLSTIEGAYTLLAFWDATCAHCRETLPQLDTVFQAKWKAAGLKLVAVSIETDGTKTDWENYLREHTFADWTNLYDSHESENTLHAAGQKGIVLGYDMWYYPCFFLLDKDKRFVGKKLQFKEVSELIESLLGKK